MSAGVGFYHSCGAPARLYVQIRNGRRVQVGECRPCGVQHRLDRGPASDEEARERNAISRRLGQLERSRHRRGRA